jgi:hypothetical protein
MSSISPRYPRLFSSVREILTTGQGIMQTRAGGRDAHESEPARMLYLLAFSLDVEELLLPILPCRRCRGCRHTSFSRRESAPGVQRASSWMSSPSRCARQRLFKVEGLISKTLKNTNTTLS